METRQKKSLVPRIVLGFIGGGVATWTLERVLDHMWSWLSGQKIPPFWNWTVSLPLWAFIVAGALGAALTVYWSRILGWARALWSSLQRPSFPYEVGSLRRQVWLLSRDMRQLSIQIAFDKKPLQQIKAEWKRLQPTYWTIKSYLELAVGANHPMTAALTTIVPIASAEFDMIAEVLDRIAALLPSHYPAVDITKDVA